MMGKSAIPFLLGLGGMLLVGWVVFPKVLYRSEAQPIQFSHATHAGEKAGMACEDCHAVLVDGRYSGIPAVAKCAECHSAQLGESPEEKILVEEYVLKNRDIDWRVYARQPENVYFSHSPHLRQAHLDCIRCHGPHGTSNQLRPYQVNRISGYSRDIWGPGISGLKSQPWEGMKMDDCSACHHERGVQESCLDCHK